VHLKETATVDNDYRYAIPGANIGDTDLAAIARVNPEVAEEIARLEGLMHRGEETKEEFLHLCQLLFDVGSVAAAEYLLRRNLDYYEGQDLYTRLFGTVKVDEFDAAVEAFRTQFDLELELVAQEDFLVKTFHLGEGPPRSDRFALLSAPCEIKIGYIDQERIEADIVLLDPNRDVVDADECMLMHFVNGVWEIVDSMDA
jgi:hypothetical protein